MESILLVRRNARCSAACWLIPVVVSGGGLAAVGCGRVSESMPPLDTQARPAGSVADITPQSVAEIKNFCGDCHALPLATSFPGIVGRKRCGRATSFTWRAGDRT